MSPKTTEKPLTPAERMRLHRKRRRSPHSHSRRRLLGRDVDRGAERAWRDRGAGFAGRSRVRRNGLRFMRILLHETEIDALIRKGFLKRERRQDQHAVQNAIDGFICNELGPADALGGALRVS